MDQIKTKMAYGIEQPVRVGENAIIYLPSTEVGKDYNKAKTFVKEILYMRCENNYYYVTIRTRNSIYQDIPLNYYIRDVRYNGQVLDPGTSVMVQDGSWKTVASIIGIEDHTLFIKDTQGIVYKAYLWTQQ